LHLLLAWVFVAGVLVHVGTVTFFAVGVATATLVGTVLRSS